MISIAVRLALAAGLGLEAAEAVYPVPHLPLGGSIFLQSAFLVISALIFDELWEMWKTWNIKRKK